MDNFFLKGTVFSCISIILSAISINSQTPYCMTAPIGYGAATTGGGTPTSSNTVTVTSSSELSSALSGNKSIILVSGTITTGRISGSYANKSIIGLPGAKLTNLTQNQSGSGILELKSGSNNIIIRNLVFVGPGAYDCDGFDLLTNVGCTKLWVDHCEFQDGVDGNYDNTKTADNITVSWCKFTYLKSPKAGGSGGANDHRFTNLVGGSDTDVPADGKYSITWLNCWWADGCVDRMVRARNAQIDMLNCYWNSKNASKNIHLSPGTNGTYVYVENGVFACSGEIVNFEKTGNNNVKFVNCTGGGANTGSVSKPSYSYSLSPAGDVAGMVTKASCGAGATLKVTATGEISSSCTPTTSTIRETTTKKDRRESVRIGNNSTITLPLSSSENIRVVFYSMNGQKVCSFLKTVDKDTHRNIGLPGTGIYYVKIMDNNTTMIRTIFNK